MIKIYPTPPLLGMASMRSVGV